MVRLGLARFSDLCVWCAVVWFWVVGLLSLVVWVYDVWLDLVLGFWIVVAWALSLLWFGWDPHLSVCCLSYGAGFDAMCCVWLGLGNLAVLGWFW